MLEERGVCELCGQVWCGRPCLNDPDKANRLLFHADGRAKSLRERGLGWDDPAVKVVGPKLRVVPPALRKLVTKTPVTETGGVTETVTETRPVTETGRKGGRPKKDGALSAAERQARRRARLRKGGGE